MTGQQSGVGEPRSTVVAPLSPLPRGRRRLRIWVAVASAPAVVAAVAATIVLLDREADRAVSGTRTPVPLVTGESVPDPAVADDPPMDPARALTWEPPGLDSPQVLHITQDDRSPQLDSGQDYVIELPEEPVRGEVSISGGDDVVMMGGEITVPAGSDNNRALVIKGQTGTVHVEGVALTGAGLGEGVNLDQRLGATVQLQNIRVDTVTGSQEGHHADLLQTWGGPRRLLVDGFTGTTTYQGFFLLPMQFDDAEPQLFDLRRVDITGVGEEHGYLLWRDDNSWPLRLTDVSLRAVDAGRSWEQVVWPRGESDLQERWSDVTFDRPGSPSHVLTGVAGIGYTSPGYRS